MTSRRGVVFAACMARPVRSAMEVDLVNLAKASLPATLSERRRCARLAERVVAEVFAENERSDPFEIALADAARRLNACPVLLLASDPGIALGAELVRERMRRFEARGCRQISTDAWARETGEIRAALIKRFADRFRRA